VSICTAAGHTSRGSLLSEAKRSEDECPEEALGNQDECCCIKF
jgi:hypothetical protein